MCYCQNLRLTALFKYKFVEKFGEDVITLETYPRESDINCASSKSINFVVVLKFWSSLARSFKTFVKF